MSPVILKKKFSLFITCSAYHVIPRVATGQLCLITANLKAGPLYLPRKIMQTTFLIHR